MIKTFAIVAAGCFVLVAGQAMANDYLTSEMSSTVPITRYRAVATTAAMPVTYAAPTTAYQPVNCCQPVSCCQPVTAYQPINYCQTTVAAQPVVAYQPVQAPMQVIAYQPIAAPMQYTAYAPVAAPAIATPGYVTRTKFYVPGQPVRNVFRAVLPGVPTGVVAAGY